MGKKRTKPKPPVTVGVQTPDTLIEIAREFETLATQLRVAADTLSTAGVTELNVGSHSSLKVGLERIQGFIVAVHKSRREYLMQAGKLGQSVSPEGHTSPKNKDLRQ